jgi:hypothetical protein
MVRVARKYPVVTITGPRQSGKTTLCRRVFPRLRYVNLEQLDERAYARDDPRGFLAEHAEGALLDEVQHVPSLLSYLQVEVDERPRPGRWILTGSEHLGLTGAVAQTLAGRTALLNLMPLSLEELRRFPDPPAGLDATLVAGGYPRIHDQGLESDRWLGDYARTYLERDVRRLLDVGNLEAFTTFMRLLAGRTAQELNLSSVGSDAGVTHNTARSWLSVLEASFLLFRVPAWSRNPRKRLVKAPKVHWMDSGLACHLLGIRSPEHLRSHPLRGAIFESWVASEIYKGHAGRGQVPRLHHLRETRGIEVDLIVEGDAGLRGVECKVGATVPSDAFRGLRGLPESTGRGTSTGRGVLVYGGDERQRRSAADVVPWHRVGRVQWFA